MALILRPAELPHQRLRLPRRRPSPSAPFRRRSCFHPTRSGLPFPPERARYHRELEAAVGAVQRACRLCVEVQKSILSSDGRILRKDDKTPVTVADYGVQALISLELGKLFPSIPLVAEEDSAFLRSNTENANLIDCILDAVESNASDGTEGLTSNDVLRAIDRGGKDAFSFNKKPVTYWVLDPIDGTRGFLRGRDALYVVGLALVVEGRVKIGVMGCPNWKRDPNPIKDTEAEILGDVQSENDQGIIMASHVGCGTWMRKFSVMLGNMSGASFEWSRCLVDNYAMVHEAIFCISDSQSWQTLPLSKIFRSRRDANSVESDKEVFLMEVCCGSLCKYLMIASGRASVFILGAIAEKQIKAWDHAVGIICVHEAGGQVTDWLGSPIDVSVDVAERRTIFPSGGVLVTNGVLHRQILDMISTNPTAN